MEIGKQSCVLNVGEIDYRTEEAPAQKWHLRYPGMLEKYNGPYGSGQGMF